jgi:hypothetical protein
VERRRWLTERSSGPHGWRLVMKWYSHASDLSFCTSAKVTLQPGDPKTVRFYFTRSWSCGCSDSESTERRI